MYWVKLAPICNLVKHHMREEVCHGKSTWKFNTLDNKTY